MPAESFAVLRLSFSSARARRRRARLARPLRDHRRQQQHALSTREDDEEVVVVVMVQGGKHASVAKPHSRLLQPIAGMSQSTCHRRERAQASRRLLGGAWRLELELRHGRDEGGSRGGRDD